MTRNTAEETFSRAGHVFLKVYGSISYLFILCIIFIERVLDLLGLAIEAVSHLFRLVISLLEIVLLTIRFSCWLFRFLRLQGTLGILLIALSCLCFWPDSQYAMVLSEVLPAWTVTRCYFSYWIIILWILISIGVILYIALKI